MTIPSYILDQFEARNVRLFDARSNDAGRRIARYAESLVGIVEDPALSDTGVNVNRWNALYGLNAVPWGATFCGGVYAEERVSDQGIIRASLEDTWAQAVALHRVFKVPVTGCLVMFGEFNGDDLVTPVALEIFIRWLDKSSWLVQTVSGNSWINDTPTNHGVTLNNRNIVQVDPDNGDIYSRFIIPTSVSLTESRRVYPGPLDLMDA